MTKTISGRRAGRFRLSRWLCFVLVVVLASCRSSNPSPLGEVVAEPESATTSTPESSQEVESSAASTPQIEGDELAEVSMLLGWGLTDGESARHHVSTMKGLIVLREEHVARCMREQGFEYQATSDNHQIAMNEDPEAKWDTPEFTEKYGFGQSTLIFAADQVAPDGIGFDLRWRSQLTIEETNANADYFWSLDEATQASYEDALNGPDVAELGGCVGDAESAFPDRASSVRFSLAEAMEETDERVRASAEHAELVKGVNECMDVSDFTFAGVNDMYGELNADVELLRPKVDLSRFEPDEDGNIAIDADSLSAGPRVTGEGIEVGSPEWLTRLVELQQHELSMASEFERCIGMDAWIEAYDAMAEPFRQEFLADNLVTITDLGAIDVSG